MNRYVYKETSPDMKERKTLQYTVPLSALTADYQSKAIKYKQTGEFR